jgi:hypothetical protein
MYYIGIDLRDWHIDEVAKLKALIIEVENRKQIPEHSQTIIASQ